MSAGANAVHFTSQIYKFIYTK